LNMKLGYMMTSPYNALGWSDHRTTRFTSIKNNNFLVNVGTRKSNLVRQWNNFTKKKLLFWELVLGTVESTMTNGTRNTVSEVDNSDTLSALRKVHFSIGVYMEPSFGCGAQNII
jgi:hypothetical protein